VWIAPTRGCSFVKYTFDGSSTANGRLQIVVDQIGFDRFTNGEWFIRSGRWRCDYLDASGRPTSSYECLATRTFVDAYPNLDEVLSTACIPDGARVSFEGKRDNKPKTRNINVWRAGRVVSEPPSPPLDPLDARDLQWVLTHRHESATRRTANGVIAQMQQRGVSRARFHASGESTSISAVERGRRELWKVVPLPLSNFRKLFARGCGEAPQPNQLSFTDHKHNYRGRVSAPTRHSLELRLVRRRKRSKS
jgi:hypothetical protein